jgi:hypothetical protein
MGNKTTLVLGASENPERYSNKAIKMLRKHGHDVSAVGKDAGKVEDVIIHTMANSEWKVDTVTLYLNPQLQKSYYDEILKLKPRRIVFNPGTENEELKKLAELNGIEAAEACTLVLLSTGQY